MKIPKLPMGVDLVHQHHKLCWADLPVGARVPRELERICA